MSKYNKNNVALGFVERISKKYTIVVTSSNRKRIPCIHVIDCKTFGSEFDCKISLTESRYLKDTPDILTVKQKYDLIKTLQTKTDSVFGKKSIWFLYMYSFKISNKSNLDINMEMPDYTTLKTKDSIK